jgi:hypothetical protein
MTSDENEFKAFQAWKAAREKKPPAPAAPRQDAGVTWSVGLVLLVAGFIAYDHSKGGVLPDDFYCHWGAGKIVTTVGITQPGGWSVGNGCDAHAPGCEASWIHTPATSRCIHGSLWDAIRQVYKENPR